MALFHGKLVAATISGLICAVSAAKAENITEANSEDCVAHSFGACLQQVAVSDPGEPEMAWTANRFDDGPDPVALLRYGIPETDAVGFEATCEKSGGAKTIFGYDTGKFTEGQDVVLEISGEGYESQLPAKVHGTQLEVGVSGIMLDLPLDAPVWQAFQGGSSLAYQAGGGSPQRLDLKGAGRAVGKFIADCKAIVADATPQAEPPTPPAKAETEKPPAPEAKLAPQAEAKAETAGPPLSSGDAAPNSERLSCKRFGTIKSVESKTPAKVTFVNKSDGYRAVMWIDFEGHPVDYAGLDQGETFTTPTHLTHPWMITDGPGNCIEMFMPQKAETQFELTVPSPVFGPEDD